MLSETGIKIGKDCEIELSHHYGLDKFREYGALIISIMNREYCKKIIILLPDQKHPIHFHKKKEETFQLLWGDMEVYLESRIYTLNPGDQLLVKRNDKHSFTSKYGAIFEEISTTHIKDDSFYDDDSINRLDPMERKTNIDKW